MITNQFLPRAIATLMVLVGTSATTSLTGLIPEGRAIAPVTYAESEQGLENFLQDYLEAVKSAIQG